MKDMVAVFDVNCAKCGVSGSFIADEKDIQW